MSATTGGSMKAYVESLGLSLPAFRDNAPEEQKPPFVTIREAIGKTPDGLEDGTVLSVTEPIELNLWQDYLSRDPDTGKTTIVESATLADALYKKLHGARINPIGTAVVYGVLVKNSIRVQERDNKLVRQIYELDVKRGI